MKKTLFLLLAFCFLWQIPLVCADAEGPRLDEGTIKACNDYVLAIYQEIEKAKASGRYEELASFGDDAFFKNQHGIYAIVYQFGVDDPNEKDKRKTPYKIGLSIVPLDDPLFSDKKGFFESPMEPLGLKIVGYQKKHLLRTQYNYLPLLQKFSEDLLTYQQQFLPLRIEIEPLQEEFKTKDPIEFEVLLVNVSKYNMLVDSLSRKSLYFTVDGREWGTQEAEEVILTPRQQRRLARQQRREARAARRKKTNSKEEILNKKEEIKGQKILRAGEALIREYKGESFLEPRTLEVKAYYRMKLKGVSPYTKMTIKIVED